MHLLKEIFSTVFSDHTIGQKLNYIKYKISRKDDHLSYDPITISIVATTRCTLSCDMCPTHSPRVPRDYPYIQKNESDIDLGMFKEIVDNFRSAVNVNIIGSGEPLLNKDFFKMVDYAADKKMAVKTFSNGTTIRDNIGKILSSKLDGITISINGHDSKEFKRLTGMDEKIYFDIYESIKMLIDEKEKRKSRIKVKLSFIIDKYNYKFIPQMIELSLKLDADHIFLCNFLSCPYEGLTTDERVLMADDEVIAYINSAMAKYPASLRRNITLPTLLDTNRTDNHCESYFSQIRFDGDGNVSSCSMMLLNMTGDGNYKDKDVWNSESFRSMRRRFLSGKRKDLLEPCLSCPDNFGVYPWR